MPVNEETLTSGRRHRIRLLAAALSLLLPLSAGAQASDPHEERPLPAPLQETRAATAPADASRIVGGNEVPLWVFRQNFRWMASLQVRGQHGFTHACGATIIRPRWALTAAHCVQRRRPEDFSLRVNARHLSGGARRVGISGFVMHPDYELTDRFQTNYDNDIALLRLAEAVHVPRVSLARRAFDNDLAGPFTRATILGWGRTNPAVAASADILQRAQVPIIGLGRCRNNYPGFSVTNRMLCAGWPRGGRDSCQGDSGGPIIVRDNDGNWQQVGITSWGVGCAEPNRPGVYTRVGAFTQFINRGTRGLGRACYDRSWPAHFRTPFQFECHSFRGFGDSSTGPIPIGFPVRMGNSVYSRLYINNNGTVTFDRALAGHLPSPIRTFIQPVIAPYMNAVSTTRAGAVHYGRAMINGRRAFMVIWDDVPSFNPLSRGTNTFQLVLIDQDRERRRMRIEFNYAGIDYNWWGAQVGFSTGRGGVQRTVGGSGRPQSFVDGADNALISRSNVGRPGRFAWTLVGGNHVR